MNAKELTEKYWASKYRLDDYEKRIDFLEQENSKLRRMIEDVQVDIKMMQNMRK